MTWRYDFGSNLGRIRRRVEKLERGYREFTWHQDPVKSYYLGSLVVELDNVCVDGLRELALAAIRAEQTRGHTVRRVGRRPILDGEYSALVVEAMKPRAYNNRGKPLTMARREEPTIRDPLQIRSVLGVAGVAPYPDLTNAIALNFGVFRQLKVPRHYYAHRNKTTFMEVLSMFGVSRLGSQRDPDQVLHFKPTATRSPQFLEWTAEVRAFFETAIT